jgi:predicted glycosyltransferase
VHFFKNIIFGLSDRGHIYNVISRDKDITNILLSELNVSFFSVGDAKILTKLGHLLELFKRDYKSAIIAQRFKPDVILTRGPVGVHVGKILGVPTIYDTDDGRAVGALFSLAANYADIITSPDCIKENYGRNHIKYPSYKQLAYLHPNHFTPDQTVLNDLGVTNGEKYFIVRFVEMIASHDEGESGFPAEAKRELVNCLLPFGRVFISYEGKIPKDLLKFKFPLPHCRLHHALAFCNLFIGDSQTMTAEAAVLGIPNLRVSSWSGRLEYLSEIQEKYGLTHSYLPNQLSNFFERLKHMLKDLNQEKNIMKTYRAKLLNEKIDVATWFLDFIESRKYMRN